ncbi:MAG: DUF481 domain-containing protein [Deltaproteobacteria bacterium]|nr:DUF481 domain-containing protein [Deltaproteobacteria bacterium]
MTLAPLLAVLLAQAAPAKPAKAAAPAPAGANASANAAAESAAKAAESAAASANANADATKKAVDAAQSAAESAAKAAEAAAKAADSAAKAADKAAEALAKMAPPAAPPAAAAAAPAPGEAPKPPPVTWTGSLGAGAIVLTGNSNTLTFTGKAAFERKSTDWIFSFKAGGAYGQTREAQTDANQTTALNGGLLVRGDRRFNPMLSIFVSGAFDADHVKSIEARPVGELGIGLAWFDTKEGDFSKTSLRTDLGFKYGREYRFQYALATGDVATDVPDVDLVAPHMGLAYRYAISKEIIFTEDVDVSVNVVGDVRMILNSQSKLSAKLTDSTALGIQLGVIDDTVPAPGKVNVDTTLAITLDIAL